MMEDDNYPRNKPMRKETSEMEDLDGTGMDKGAVAMDLQRRESHMERTTGERKVDGLEHRLSNELAWDVCVLCARVIELKKEEGKGEKIVFEIMKVTIWSIKIMKWFDIKTMINKDDG